ncbi:hypothetical protein D3C71_2057490 [compost metagenome]
MLASAATAGPAWKPARLASGLDRISSISATITSATVPANGKFCQKPSRSFSMLLSSIITTNRNNTITAPT